MQNNNDVPYLSYLITSDGKRNMKSNNELGLQNVISENTKFSIVKKSM